MKIHKLIPIILTVTIAVTQFAPNAEALRPMAYKVSEETDAVLDSVKTSSTGEDVKGSSLREVDQILTEYKARNRFYAVSNEEGKRRLEERIKKVLEDVKAMPDSLKDRFGKGKVLSIIAFGDYLWFEKTSDISLLVIKHGNDDIAMLPTGFMPSGANITFNVITVGYDKFKELVSLPILYYARQGFGDGITIFGTDPYEDAGLYSAMRDILNLNFLINSSKELLEQYESVRNGQPDATSKEGRLMSFLEKGVIEKTTEALAILKHIATKYNMKREIASLESIEKDWLQSLVNLRKYYKKVCGIYDIIMKRPSIKIPSSRGVVPPSPKPEADEKEPPPRTEKLTLIIKNNPKLDTAVKLMGYIGRNDPHLLDAISAEKRLEFLSDFLFLGYETTPLSRASLAELAKLKHCGERINLIKAARRMDEEALCKSAGITPADYKKLAKAREIDGAETLFKISRALLIDPILILKGGRWDRVSSDLPDNEKVRLCRLRKGWTPEACTAKLEVSGLRFTLTDKISWVLLCEKDELTPKKDQIAVLRRVFADDTLYEKALEAEKTSEQELATPTQEIAAPPDKNETADLPPKTPQKKKVTAATAEETRGVKTPPLKIKEEEKEAAVSSYLAYDALEMLRDPSQREIVDGTYIEEIISDLRDVCYTVEYLLAREPDSARHQEITESLDFTEIKGLLEKFEALVSTRLCDWDRRAVRQKVADITLGLIEDLDKVNKIKEWIEENINAIDESRECVNIPASGTLTSLKGSHFNKVNLTVAMLRAIGIPARHKIVHYKKGTAMAGQPSGRAKAEEYIVAEAIIGEEGYSSEKAGEVPLAYETITLEPIDQDKILSSETLNQVEQFARKAKASSAGSNVSIFTALSEKTPIIDGENAEFIRHRGDAFELFIRKILVRKKFSPQASKELIFELACLLISDPDGFSHNFWDIYAHAHHYKEYRHVITICGLAAVLASEYMGQDLFYGSIYSGTDGTNDSARNARRVAGFYRDERYAYVLATALNIETNYNIAPWFVDAQIATLDALEAIHYETPAVKEHVLEVIRIFHDKVDTSRTKVVKQRAKEVLETIENGQKKPVYLGLYHRLSNEFIEFIHNRRISEMKLIQEMEIFRQSVKIDTRGSFMLSNEADKYFPGRSLIDDPIDAPFHDVEVEITAETYVYDDSILSDALDKVRIDYDQALVGIFGGEYVSSSLIALPAISRPMPYLADYIWWSDIPVAEAAEIAKQLKDVSPRFDKVADLSSARRYNLRDDDFSMITFKDNNGNGRNFILFGRSKECLGYGYMRMEQEGDFYFTFSYLPDLGPRDDEAENFILNFIKYIVEVEYILTKKFRVRRILFEYPPFDISEERSIMIYALSMHGFEEDEEDDSYGLAFYIHQPSALYPVNRTDAISRQAKNEPEILIDIGSGNGGISGHWTEKYPQAVVYALDTKYKDPDEQSLKNLRERAPKAIPVSRIFKYWQTDELNRRVDQICWMFTEGADRLDAIKIAQLLKPGGTMIMVLDTVKDGPDYNWFEEFRDQLRREGLRLKYESGIPFRELCGHESLVAASTMYGAFWLFAPKYYPEPNSAILYAEKPLANTRKAAAMEISDSHIVFKALDAAA